MASQRLVDIGKDRDPISVSSGNSTGILYLSKFNFQVLITQPFYSYHYAEKLITSVIKQRGKALSVLWLC
jgi:hypothetical protein